MTTTFHRSKQIREIVTQLVTGYQPEKIILFGSSARGDNRADSDFDLLVVKRGVDGMSKGKRYTEVSQYIDHGEAVDLLVYTPYEIKKRLFLGDPFFTQIVTEGKVLYGDSYKDIERENKKVDTILKGQSDR